MAIEHAILGASSAYRWITCTPSARFEEQIEDEGSKYAQEGTVAHDFAALHLEQLAVIELPPVSFSERINVIAYKGLAHYAKIDKLEGTKTDGDAKIDEMIEHAQTWANTIVARNPDKVIVEQRVDLSAFVPLGFGTTDAASETPDVLYVDDYKYGEGIPVSAEENPQLMLYGLGALLAAIERNPKYNPYKVVLSIFQPRVSDVWSTWEIETKELIRWGYETVLPKGKLAIAGQGDFIAGDHCHFCKAKTSCKAYYNIFEDILETVDTRIMTPRDVRQVLTYGDKVTSWIKKVKEETLNKMRNKQKVHGFKLVKGRGQRQFINEDDVIEYLIAAGVEGDVMFDTKLRSLTGLEEALGKKRFTHLLGELIYIKEGSPQIAPDDDKRVAVSASAHSVYEDEEYEDLN